MSDKHSTANTTPTRGKPGGYSSTRLWQKRRQKQFEADDRQAKYDALSLDEKIKGLGPTGSTKQRAKLLKLKAAHSTDKTPVVKKKMVKS
jgi:hypothetical protein